MKNSIIFKMADEDWEFEKINELNYQTFVEEIPQHETNKNKTLIDKFNDENTYFIALKNKELLGMVTIRDKRPFSLDKKLDNLDSYLPQTEKKCEVRLLSVKKEYRNGLVLVGLLREISKYINKNHYDIILISGILNQQKLYKHIGFIPFGPIVGNDSASFQPMYMLKEKCNLDELLDNKKKLSFLPGPVQICDKVIEAFRKPPFSHRSLAFKKIFFNTKKMLCNLVNAKYVELFMGSGTLANDVIAAELSLLKSKGLILSNGEFGDRLINHGKRFKLDFKTYNIDYGKSFNLDEIENILEKNKDIKWIFMTHCETSSGILNDIKHISALCKNRGVLLCLDTISSIGNVDVDLSTVYLASCVSGKGLSSFCGLSMVFYNHELLNSNDNIPRYFDLYKYSKEEGIPYTISSNLVYALHESLLNLNKQEKFNNIKKLNNYFRLQLKDLGFEVLNKENVCCPSVVTIPIPLNQSSKVIGDALKKKGFLISYESSYLLKRNWIQVCFMGKLDISDLKMLINNLTIDNNVQNLQCV